MPHHASVTLALLAWTSACSAQTLPPCAQELNLSTDSLTRLAATLHPQIADNRRNDCAVVALVFESDCRLIRHAFGYRRGPVTIDSVLAQFFPDSESIAYSSGGFTDFREPTDAEFRLWAQAGDGRRDGGTPWVTWAVHRTARR